MLIASFTLREDAIRLGSLATQPEVLSELVLRSLAEAHKGLHPDITYEFLRDQFVDMHVKDWGRKQDAMGTFDGAAHHTPLIALFFLRGYCLPRLIFFAHIPSRKQVFALCRGGSEYATRVSDI